MMQKYLKELIEGNSRVIVPDFGAFMVQNSASGKQISFNDFLKFNDGLLTNEIIKAEKLTKTEATEKIKAFVKEMLDTFAQNKPYLIEGVGSLSKDGMGNIKFESAAGGAAKATETANPAEPKKEPEVKKETTTKTEQKSPPIPPKPNTEKTAPAKPAEKTASKPIPNKPSATAQKAKPAAKPAAPAAKKPAAQKPAKSSSSGGGGKVVIIIVVILAVLGLVGGGLFFFGIIGGRTNPFDIKIPEVITADTVVADTTPVAVDTTPAPEPQPEPKVVEEPASDASSKGYHIIAGCFGVPSNANNYNAKLISEGYSSSIIIERRSGLKAVSYKSFDTFEEALAEWRELRVVNPETWILVSK